MARGIVGLFVRCVHSGCGLYQVGMMEGDWLQQTCKWLRWIKRARCRCTSSFWCGVGQWQKYIQQNLESTNCISFNFSLFLLKEKCIYLSSSMTLRFDDIKQIKLFVELWALYLSDEIRRTEPLMAWWSQGHISSFWHTRIDGGLR